VNVHFWHLADLYAETEQVPSWAQTRRGLAKAQGPLLTLSGHVQTSTAGDGFAWTRDNAPVRDNGLVWIVSPMAMREADCRSRVLGSAQKHVLRSAGTDDEAHNQGDLNHGAQHLGCSNRSACSRSRGGLRRASARRGCSPAPCDRRQTQSRVDPHPPVIRCLPLRPSMSTTPGAMRFFSGAPMGNRTRCLRGGMASLSTSLLRSVSVTIRRLTARYP
jgi:hypothetical protein